MNAASTHPTKRKTLFLGIFALVPIALIYISPVLAHGGNPRVVSVVPDGPASVAGLRGGDSLLSIAGHRIVDSSDLQNVLAAHSPGERVPVVIERDGEERTVHLVFGERSDHGGVSLGVSLELASAAPAAYGEGPVISGEECLEWVDTTYRLDAIAPELGLDLVAEIEENRACMEGDLRRMPPTLPRRWCDNVFKIHCSGVDLVTEIGEALVRRCESSWLAELSADGGAEPATRRRCASNLVFERYAEKGLAPDASECVQLFEECGS